MIELNPFSRNPRSISGNQNNHRHALLPIELFKKKYSHKKRTKKPCPEA